MEGWYQMLKEFQTFLVGVLGFTGVIITLIVNGRKDRSLHIWKQERERQAISSGLKSEIKMFMNTLQSNISGEENALKNVSQGGALLVPKDFYKPIFFPSCTKELALLPQDVVGSVIRGYIFLQEYPIQLFSIVSRTKADEHRKTSLTEHYYIVHNPAAVKRISAYHSTILEAFKDALERLENIK